MRKIRILLMVLICSVSICVITPKQEVYATSLMTIEQLREKFPNGKYWNHLPGTINNPDGWSEIACSHHFTTGCNYNGSCGCNNVGQGWSAIQCMGFAYKLAYDAFGSNPGSSWATITGTNAKEYVLNNIKPGDVVRLYDNTHSMFVTGVNGNIITFAECNVKGTCIIRWDQTTTRAQLNETLTNVKIAPDTFENNEMNIRFTYDLLGGTGEFPVQTIKYTQKLTIPNNEITKNGYSFNGFSVYREQDKKYYTAKNKWQTQKNIDVNGYEKRVYPLGSSYNISTSWTTSPASQYSFVFTAIWKPVDISVKFDAFGGSGTYNEIYVIKDTLSLPMQNKISKTGSKLKGFYFFRTEDNTYMTSNGWQNQESINKNGYTKKIYEPGSILTIDKSWTNDFETQNTYSFIAVWEDETASVILDHKVVSLNRGESYTLNATISPADTKDKTLTWTSSDEDVVTVKNGVLKAKNAGNAIITVSTNDDKRATCIVIVREKAFPFTDVNDIQWYYSYINETYQLGLMSGTTETLFKPSANMNRAMVAIVFHRMEGSPKVEYSSAFKDVADNQYYTSSVLWAKQNGIINGYMDGTFKPTKNVTREEMATMIYNFAKYKKIKVQATKDITGYKDYSEITPYGIGTLQWAIEKGIISGKDNGTRLDPLGNATRAECAKMLVQAHNLIY